VIRTVALDKVYRGRTATVHAVDHLDLHVRPGEIFGLLGPNGAGKTTTVGMLTARVVPTAGRAHIGEVDVTRQPALAKQLIGVVPQTNTLDRSLSVFENLWFHGRYFGMPGREARREADALLDRFSLADRRDTAIDELSGGLAQRVQLARAIMHRPRVLFLDEPTAGLDPQSRLALWEVVRELHTAGQTILLTTHYMEEADQLCDRVAIMDHGRILALDTPFRLKATVGAAREIRLHGKGDLGDVAAALGDLAGTAGARVVDDAVHVFVLADGPALPELIARADTRGFVVRDVGVTEPSLETVFINLTGKDLRE